MYIGYRAGVAVTSLVLALGLWGAAPKPHAGAKPAAARNRAASGRRDDPDALYSSRALRRVRLILQLRLLELRKAHLERVRQAIERHLSVDRLLQEEAPSPTSSPQQRGAS